MDTMNPHPDHTLRGVKRPGRMPSWVIAAIGVHFLLATVANASDATMPSVERTKVRRISESVVQVLRELVDRTAPAAPREPGSSGFRVIESAPRGIGVVVGVLTPRMLDERMLDLPPPVRG